MTGRELSRLRQMGNTEVSLERSRRLWWVLETDRMNKTRICSCCVMDDVEHAFFTNSVTLTRDHLIVQQLLFSCVFASFWWAWRRNVDRGRRWWLLRGQQVHVGEKQEVGEDKSETIAGLVSVHCLCSACQWVCQQQLKRHSAETEKSFVENVHLPLETHAMTTAAVVGRVYLKWKWSASEFMKLFREKNVCVYKWWKMYRTVHVQNEQASCTCTVLTSIYNI